MVKRLDLTGQRYGRLTVIEEKEQIGKYRYWLCRCDCGKFYKAKQENLRSGNTRSCGCLKNEYYRDKLDDLTGKRFGKLTALKPIGRKYNSVAWECLCDCGNVIETTQNQLTSRGVRSCGCMTRKRLSIDQVMQILIDVYLDVGKVTPFELRKRTGLQAQNVKKRFNGRDWDEIWELVDQEIAARNSQTRKPKIKLGDKFGRLTVIHNTGKRKNGKIVWLCRCKCGNEIEVRTSYLTSGETRSCGCLKKDLENKNLRDAYDSKRVDGVVKPLFKGKEPRKDSSTGFRGVSKYYTRKSKELRYRAWITVKGKRYYKSGFNTAEDAYFNGRLMLEEMYLPKQEESENE